MRRNKRDTRRIKMKNIVLIVTLLALMLTFAGCAQKNVEADNVAVELEKSTLIATEIPVQGACGMCKGRIEEAAKTVEGVEVAVWDQETDMLTIETTKGTDVMMVHKAVSTVGHDTDKMKADDEVYTALPGCCKYRDME